MGYMQRIGIGFCIDSNGWDTHFFQGADDANGNGATVGDEHFVEHGGVPVSCAGRPACCSFRPGRPGWRFKKWCVVNVV